MRKALLVHRAKLGELQEAMRTGYAILPIAVLAVALSLSVGCSRQGAQAAAPATIEPLVTVAMAKSRNVPVYLDEIGRTGAFEAVTVTPQVAGRITERHFDDGAELKPGQLLFVIDPRPYQAQLDSAQAQLAQANAALQLANTQLKMYDSIANTRAVSQLDIETKKNSVAVDQAQLQAAEAAVENAKLNLDYCYIHSPITGLAGARLVDIGNVVQANTTGLLLIQRIDPIYADFTITEQDLARVRPAMSGGALEALVRIPSDPDGGRRGQVTFLDNAVQNGTGTINLRATVQNADHRFWPGQFVNVTLVLQTSRAVLIPYQASQISQQGPYVFVVRPDNTAELRPVVLGQRQGEAVVVSKGVEDGERVIVTGQLTVQPGAKVRIATPAPAGSGSNQDSTAGGKS
jgi:multidrug efflux system membrane fusion protein